MLAPAGKSARIRRDAPAKRHNPLAGPRYRGPIHGLPPSPMSTQTAALPIDLAGPAAGAKPAARTRIEIIDMMRGLVMVVMMLDHVRETIYLHKVLTDPMDVAATDPALYLNRLAAHFCAPIFVFLTGLGAWLYANPSSGAPRPVGGFLAKRGLLLVVLEITVVNFAFMGELPPSIIYLQVIWVIGLSMIVLAAIHRLPRPALWAIAIALVFGHNLLSNVHFRPDEPGFVLWSILHDRGFLVADGPLRIRLSYPLLPWIGVITFGWLAGSLFARSVEPARRRRTFLLAGLGCWALLLVLRGTNFYGETLPWATHADALRTVMSFFNFTKYPPSLDFLLLTLGGGMLGMAVWESARNAFTRVLVVFGSVPMFYYVLHLFVLQAIQQVAVLTLGANHGSRFGVDSIVPVWLLWIAVVPVLYWPCVIYGRFKRTTKQAWVSYF